MKLEQLKEDIRETNLAYLMLAQSMLREDRTQAMFRLGISEEVAQILENLTAAQVLKLAGSSMLMCAFRFDDEMVWELLTSHSRDRAADAAARSGLHASILMSGAAALQPAAAA